MLSRILLKLFVIAICVVPAVGQTTTGANNPSAPPPSRDPVDIKVQEALRERDAIIRNLLERVQELEWRVNGGFTTRPVDYASGRSAADTLNRAVTSPAYSVVSNAGYDAEEKEASEALDRALLVRGGILVPNGTLEIDNTTSYFSSSSDHLTVNGFALLPILVVGDITSQRLRKDVLMPTFTTRLGLPGKLEFDTTIPYGYELVRTVDANNVQTSASNFGLGDIQFGVSRQLLFEKGKKPDLVANVRFKTVT